MATSNGTKNDTSQLSNEESALYDRQIRLWGMKSQEKIKSSNILLIGVKVLGSEILKNLLLTGVRSVTILDDSLVTQYDKETNFLLGTQADIDKPIVEEILKKACRLNPLVKIVADNANVTSKSRDYFQQFHVVVASEVSPNLACDLGDTCFSFGVKFIYADISGSFGYFVSDLGENHEFAETVRKSVKASGHDGDGKPKIIAELQTVQHQYSYPRIKHAINVKHIDSAVFHHRRNKTLFHLYICLLGLVDFHRRFGRKPGEDTGSQDMVELLEITGKIMQMFNVIDADLNEALFELLLGDIPVVGAIMGGVIGQEIVKIVSNKEVPIKNIFLLNPVSFSGKELSSVV